MKNRVFVIAAALALLCLGISASAGTILFENWENGINTPPWTQLGVGMTLSTSYNHTPGGVQSVEGKNGVAAALDYYPTDPNNTCWYMDYWLYDTVGPSPANDYRAYLMGLTYSGGGGGGSTLQQQMIAGIYSTGMDTTKYQYKVYTGTGSWGNLTVTRSIGWHHFRIEACMTGAYADPTHGDVKVYCDDAAPVVITDQLILAQTCMRVHTNNTSSKYSTYYDDIEFGTLECVPEPSSLIAIACGMVSLIGLRRRRA